MSGHMPEMQTGANCKMHFCYLSRVPDRTWQIRNRSTHIPEWTELQSAKSLRNSLRNVLALEPAVLQFVFLSFPKFVETKHKSTECQIFLRNIKGIHAFGRSDLGTAKNLLPYIYIYAYRAHIMLMGMGRLKCNSGNIGKHHDDLGVRVATKRKRLHCKMMENW